MRERTINSLIKPLLILLAFLGTCSLQAQGELSKEQLKEQLKQLMIINICQCFNENPGVELEEFSSCWENSLVENTDRFNRLIDPESELSEYEQGHQIGYDMAMSVQEELVMTCESFAQVIDKFREESIESAKLDINKTKFKELKKTIKKGGTAQQYLQRGNYYLFKGKYKKAESDLMKSLDLKQDPGLVLLLAYLQEKLGKYELAISRYQQFAEQTQNTSVMIFASLTKRNALGKRK